MLFNTQLRLLLPCYIKASVTLNLLLTPHPHSVSLQGLRSRTLTITAIAA
jgi:hypothetical protein